MGNKSSSFSRLHFRLALAVAAAALAAGAGFARGPDDQAERAAEQAARDAERASERAARDSEQAAERAVREEARYTEDRTSIVEDAARDEARAAEDMARLEEDRLEELAKQQEDAADDLADALEDQADDAEDAAEDQADELADAAEDAEDAAEDAAEYGSSAEMRDLAASESPEFDERGFPVRRGEVVALDLGPAELAEAQRRGFGLITREALPALDAEVIRLSAPSGMDAAEALVLARQLAPEATFDLVHYYGLQFAPSGEAERSGAGEMRQRSGRLTVGMIDTGIVGHAALRDVSIEIRDFGAGAGGVPTSHGTAIASILASEGSSTIYAANIFRGRADQPHTSADALVRALEWMVASRVQVINISLSGPRNAILDRLVQRTIAGGTAIVAAAGNGGPTAPPAYPAALRNVVAVTAVDRNNRVYRYANQGRYISVAARGVDEPAASAAGGIGRFSGTSFATPHVSAWMARCMRASSVTACTSALRRDARDLGVPGFDPVYGFGLLE